MSDYIGPVRPMFRIDEEPPANKKCKRLIAGSAISGMIIDVTENGVELNAYYTGFSEGSKYSVLRDPMIISWEDLAKAKGSIGKKKRAVADLDRIEKEVDADYLIKLPIVTINGRQFYIDATRRERRSVDKPNEVWSF